MRKVRNYIFLRDVLRLTFTSFGGPQAHLTLYFKILVEKRRYLTEGELIELNSFCNILPGPASTQTLTAIGYKIGGPKLAWLTLLVWVFPDVCVMTTCAVFISYMKGFMEVTKFTQPMALGFVLFACYKIGRIALRTKTSIILAIFSTIACYLLEYPGIFPAVLIISGLITTFRFKDHPKQEKPPLNLNYGNLVLYGSIFIAAAALGLLLDYKPIKLFENFFRNGSLIFGGGQPLSGLLYKEFVQFKGYLTSEEFLTGFGILQMLPGPLFSFSSFVGSLSLSEYGLTGQIAGGFIAAVAIFLPGTLMIFFLINFWERLKKYRAVRASLEGVNAASTGIIAATALLLIQQMASNGGEPILYSIIALATFLILVFTNIPAPYIILTGLLCGFIF